MQNQTRPLGKPPAAKAWLIIHGGPDDGLAFHLRQQIITVGSSDKLSDFTIKDSSISREHIRIRREGTQHTLTDLASLNGTKVNGQPVQTCILRDDDVIRIGNTVLVYKYVSPTLA
ncbi:MAG: FHA domain-containing protein [Anaerolineae bacterium]|nr:FHA domain-containing protein [Anaerolineae bacterium]MCO5205578.1 FHA domain-containing protein [Anaerolineae bacterium]